MYVTHSSLHQTKHVAVIQTNRREKAEAQNILTYRSFNYSTRGNFSLALQKYSSKSST